MEGKREGEEGWRKSIGSGGVPEMEVYPSLLSSTSGTNGGIFLHIPRQRKPFQACPFLLHLLLHLLLILPPPSRYSPHIKTTHVDKTSFLLLLLFHLLRPPPLPFVYCFPFFVHTILLQSAFYITLLFQFLHNSVLRLHLNS